MNHAIVRPRTVRRQSEELSCTVRKIYGYQGECACGWRGSVWQTARGARLEASFHSCERRAA